MRTDRPGRPGSGPGARRRSPPPPAFPRFSGDLLYGRNAVLEALGGRRQPRRLFVAQGIQEDDRIRTALARAVERGIPIERPFRIVLDDLTDGANHQGIALEATGYPYVPLDELTAVPGTVLALDHLQDPQNFGTLLRAAEASGVSGVVMPQDRAVAVTPAVVSASAGAVEHLRVARVPNLARALDLLKEAGWWAVGLDTGPGAVDLYAADLPTPIALVVGGEGTGIGANVRRHCDLLVSLPMRGRVASLNAATAGAIALFEILRREQAATTQHPPSATSLS